MFSLVWIMPPRVMTQSAGRPAAAPQGGGTGGRASRGGGRTRGRSSDQGNGRIDGQGGQVGGQGSEVKDGVDGVPNFSTIIAQQLQNLLPTIVAQVGSQGSDQGNGRNQNGDAVNDNIRGDVRNVIENNDRRGCTYKEFLACNPKEYDGKGGAIVYTRWIKKMESVQDMSGCRDSQKEDFKTLTKEELCPSNEIQKLETELWNHAMVGAGHATHTDRFHELSRLVPHLVTPKNKRIEGYVYGLAPQIRGIVAATEPTMIQSVVLKAGLLTNEAIRNGSIKKNPKKRGNGEEASKDRNVRDDNKRSRTVSAFATTLFESGADINLIPFGSGIFDMIIGMDWFSNHKAEIICHEKVVRIPLPDGKVLRVIGKRPEEKMRHLRSDKTKEQKQEEIIVVRDYPEVFSDDLSGLPPNREIKFCIELVLEAIPVAKSPYRLAPSEMEELSGQLKKLQDKGFIRPSSPPWGT
ncbi:hypothetical protein Tco_1258232, partial [Tanacetum coccineum]